MVEELEQYKSLIIKAKGEFQIDVVIHTIGHRDSNEYEEKQVDLQTTKFNGYEPLERFKAKLKSLSIILETEYLLGDSSILSELKPLKDVFSQASNQIQHKAFEATSNVGYEPTENDFQEYIVEAYNSLTTLIDYLENEFLNLFIGNEKKVKDNKMLVDRILVEFKLIDKYGESLLTERGKAIAWVVIDLLIEGNVIKKVPERDLITKFWKYIKGSGNPPIKPHRTSDTYKKTKSKLAKYLNQIKLINDN
ncbi:MAG: hypothetical protein H7Y13_09590 [Sphingobacteriaceae bacterium]|nr:hypothetical protein [Sphingobacteriaceae bacterium]